MSEPPTQRDISAAVYELERERREFMREAMRTFDQGHYQRLRELQEGCGRLGHKWRFTHLGPLGSPWYCCGVCHASECRKEES
ncbi:hypothetical protein [Methylibium sp. Pch-M]|uniref:hypothetical protein n=1 Tax=Methylibium sp. Pch-M TaxID=2082386 RepID=UPI001010BD39|nr:hypothetical protein [Methylibium sp. Pch-M]